MQIPRHLCEAMRYSLLAGGKRVRPVLLLAACDMLGGDISQARVPAAALEMIHTYSLIHDDLPSMDNDDYRRGRLTNHKVFGEGFAILAGDGLLNYAYECILKNALDYGANLEGHILAAREIAQRAGVGGMVAGQSIDLLSEHREPNEVTLHYIHMHKTADLLTAPLLAAAYIAGADEKSITALRTFGACVGLAFQIDDDLLDVMGDAKDLGKQTGMDEQRGKMTWPSLVGVEAAQKSRASCGHRPKKRLQSLEIRRGSCANLPRRWQREEVRNRGTNVGLYYWRSSTTASFRRRRWRGPSRRRSRCF
ncbi:MAG: polyprenyl synthetase family protein [Christensenellales bacterium]